MKTRSLRPSIYCLSAIAWALVCLPVAAENYLVRTVDETYSLGDAAAIFVHLPVGKLEVRASDGESVVASLEISCGSQRQTKCVKAAETIGLVSKQNRKGLEIKIDQWPRLAAKQPDVQLTLEVPKSLGMEIDIGVGEVMVTGTEGSLEIDLGVGEIVVDLVLATVSRVELDSGVGEASLSLPAGTVDGKGFVGSSVSWSDGSGLAVVEIDVGVGEIEVDLN